jgi:hypothetical protein
MSVKVSSIALLLLSVLFLFWELGGIGQWLRAFSAGFNHPINITYTKPE